MIYAEYLIKVWRIMTTICAAVQVFTAVNQVGRMAESLRTLEAEIKRLSDCNDQGAESDLRASRQSNT